MVVGVDHRGVSRPDTVCKPEGFSQRQPAALAVVCRAELDPPPGWEGGGG